MSFDWTTFALEILNFLVLVWLLQHFLYRPVLAVIEQRRIDGEKVNAAAEALRMQAQALKTEYEARLAHAAEERDRVMARLDGEIAAERTRRLAAIEEDATADSKRRQALEARAQDERDAERVRHAITLAARFATRLLDRLASPALEESLIELTLSELKSLKPNQRVELETAFAEPDLSIQVVTAYPISPQRQAVLSAALNTFVGRTVIPSFFEDAMLKAGVRIEIGAWVLKLNLHDELEYFSVNAHHGE